jgi:hypothetical protein
MQKLGDKAAANVATAKVDWQKFEVSGRLTARGG